MNGLAWLNDLMTWLARWVPRLVLVEPTHRGVLFGPGGSTCEKMPGLLFYWPITHTLVLMPVTTQSLQLSGQVLPTLTDAIGLVPTCTVCALAVQFTVFDAVVAATRCLKVHALIDNRAQAAVANHLHLQYDRAHWIAAARQELEAALLTFGVRLERLDFTQLATGVGVKQLESGNWSDDQNGQRAT